jgi:MoaA/NifB/PqqE/SkfB family radical SAM enzyme
MSGGLSTELFRGPAGERNPNRQIPTAAARSILDDINMLGARAVQFTGGGEPTVHPEFAGIVLAAIDMGLDVGVVTNGTKLEEVPQSIDWLRVSIDAGTSATYKATRKSDRFDEVLAKVAAFVAAREGASPLVGIGYVITPDNVGEVAEGVRRAAETGADYIRLSAMFSEDGGAVFTEDERVEMERQRELIARGNWLIDVVDLAADRLGDLDQGAPDYEFCGAQHFTTYIGGDQCMYRCCTTAYTSHGKLVDLSETRLRDWWYTSEARAKLRDFDARSCKLCMFNAKNRGIAKLLDVAPPQHVNFV